MAKFKQGLKDQNKVKNICLKYFVISSRPRCVERRAGWWCNITLGCQVSTNCWYTLLCPCCTGEYIHWSSPWYGSLCQYGLYIGSIYLWTMVTMGIYIWDCVIVYPFVKGCLRLPSATNRCADVYVLTILDNMQHGLKQFVLLILSVIIFFNDMPFQCLLFSWKTSFFNPLGGRSKW